MKKRYTYTSIISTHLNSLVSAGQKCYHHVDKQDNSHDEVNTIQDADHGHCRSVSWIQWIKIHDTN